MSLTDERMPLTTGGAPPAGGSVQVPGGSSRRAERRADRAEDARQRRLDRREDAEERRLDRREDAEQRRRDREHKREQRALARAERNKARGEKKKARAKARKEARAARQARLVAVHAVVTSHMPLWGLPVVAVSLIVGWTGQAQAAAYLGMGWASLGIPVLTEGMTLTFAGLTAQAIDQRRPYKGLLAATWMTAVVAAAANASGHLIEDSSPAGMYRAGAYAAASLAALVLWAVVMRSRQARVSGKTAEETARWKRLRRRHPVLYRRARRAADMTGRPVAECWVAVVTRKQGAAPGEPSIREIRAQRRAAYRRRVAEAWDGRRWLDRRFPPEGESVPEVFPVSAADPVPTQRDVVPATVPAVVPEIVEPPVMVSPLLVPGDGDTWVRHRVTVLPASVSGGPAATSGDEAGPRFPQGQDPVSEGAENAPGETVADTAGETEREALGAVEPVTRKRSVRSAVMRLGRRSGNSGEDHERVREAVATARMETVRGMVAEAVEGGEDLTRKPSVRQVAKRLGCRPGTARELLTKALAERGITR